MTPVLEICDAGPAVTLQDLGRTGQLSSGLTRGGAMDRLALHEAAALLSQPVSAALEMVGYGGRFRSNVDTRIALTGAPMAATIDGKAVTWHGSHMLPAGATLQIGGVTSGAIGYLSVGGGFSAPHVMGAQSAHLVAGIGKPLTAGDVLPLGQDTGRETEVILVPDHRFAGGEIGITASIQTQLFGDNAFARFEETSFTRDARANRQGIRMNPEGEGFAAAGALKVVSEIIVPGDIQITGDGAPYVLMCESQSTGGYPRIATVLPSDLPRVAQTPLGATIQFRLYGLDEAVEKEAKARAARAALSTRVLPRVRDPHRMDDLLAYTLVSGVVSATDNPFAGDSE
ncbi:MAG: biotin-dependent carboxyltransferase family protein [Pseudomonadota bacterium]